MSVSGYKSKPYQMRDRVITPAVNTPVDLADVKAHLRLTATTDDAYLTNLIDVATQLMEEYLHRKLITQTLEGYLDAGNLLTSWWEGSITAAISAVGALRTIELPWSPTISVTSITLYTLDDTAFPVDVLSYRVDVVDSSMPSRISLKESQIWPGGSYRNQNSLRVEWVSGYGPLKTDVPVGIRQAVLMLVAFLYNNRGDCSGDCVGACGANMLAQPYRIYVL